MPLVVANGGITQPEGQPPTPTATPIPTPTPAPTVVPTPVPTNSSGSITLVGAGDIASCNNIGSTQTAALVAGIQGMVFALGDTAYPDGAPTDFTNCYGPTWGAFKNRTIPVIGNHEYLTANAAGYFSYFGTAAGDPTKGYYSTNLGAWHIIVLNSNCSMVGSCGPNSPQVAWLKADLAANPVKCTLALWHHPYYSSGMVGNDTQLLTVWQTLYNAGVDLVISGHDHDYERFLPQDANGNVDMAKGIMEFVAGTGGGSHTALTYPLKPNSVVANDQTFGVLKLTLAKTSFSWQFIPIQGLSFTDSGSASCH